MNLQPALHTLGVGRHIAHAHFPKLRRPVSKPRKRSLLAQIAQFFIYDGAAAGGNDDAAQALRMPENRVIGGEPAAGHADEMEPLDSQVVHQGVQIICDGAGLRPGPGIARSAPILADRR